MWLYRGAQSAVFYYATCTPCANSIDQRKRRKEAARSKRDQEKASALVTDQPRPFPQPTPFSTNDGWMEEITLGPGPPARRGGSRNNVNRVGSWNTASSDSTQRVGGKKDKSSLKNPLGERWNWMRYQREDEPLWGENVDGRGSSVGISGRGRGANSSSEYYIARVPPVNDLHPPIVSGPKSRAETRWMLQPPPSARVMAGKEHFSSSRGSPSGSSLQITDGENVASMGQKQAVSPVDRKSPTLLPSPHNLDSVNTNRPHPTSVSSHDRAQKIPSSESNAKLPRPPPPTLFLDRPGELAFGRDESNFVISPPGDSRTASLSTISSSVDSEGRSPSSPWQIPDTPISRPVSKSAADSQSFRPNISKTLSTLHRDSKDIHLLHLEINDDAHDEVGFGKLDQIRPWRWSMDI